MRENLSSLGDSVQKRLTIEKDAAKKRHQRKRWLRFVRIHFLLPSAAASVFMLMLSKLLFDVAGTSKITIVFTLHFIAILLVLTMVGLSPFTELKNSLGRFATAIWPVRNLVLFVVFVSIFPYQLLVFVFGAEGFAFIRGFVIWSTVLVLFYHLRYVPRLGNFHNYFLVKLAFLNSQIWRTFKLIMGLMSILFIFLLVELWFLAHLASPQKNILQGLHSSTEMFANAEELHKFERDSLRVVPVAPFSHLFNDFQTHALHDSLVVTPVQSVPAYVKLMKYPDKTHEPWALISSRLIVWLFAGILLTFGLIAFGGINMLIMHAAMPTALHQIKKPEKYADKVIRKAWVYAKDMRFYLFDQYSFTVFGGFVGTLIYLGLPIILYRTGQYKVVMSMLNEDTFFFAFALIAAWIVPLIIAIAKIDASYGTYFNQSVSKVIMQIKNHVVYFGYGDLGRRTVERDMNRLHALRPREELFEDMVTPDLIVERVCTAALIIDPSDRDFVYAAENDLLGRYGVIRVQHIDPMRLKDKIIKNLVASPWEFFRRWGVTQNESILVPAIKGNLAEPFAFARANLERAKLLISTVPEHYGVNAAFESITDLNTKAILCLTRSDQMNYLTYRASTREVALVYPFAAQGATMGQRLWAAVKKMQALRQLDMKNQTRPKICIIGENITKHYILESLWINIPGDHKAKAEWLEKHVIFVVAETPDDFHSENIGTMDYVMTHYRPKSRTQIIMETLSQQVIGNNHETVKRLELPLRLSSGGRYAGTQPPPLLHIPIYDARYAFAGQLDGIFKQEKPDIIVINPDNMESSLRVTMYTIRALERVFTAPEKKTDDDAHFPLMLFTLLQGNQHENTAIGDMSRFYNGLVMMHGDALAKDESYPAHARWNRMRQMIVREAIIDSNADAQEMINGIHESQFDYINSIEDEPGEAAGYMEINNCIPGVGGSLAALTAHLSGLQFREDPDILNPEIPFFQYLRAFQMDAAGRGIVITGYAALQMQGDRVDAMGEFADQQSADRGFYARMYLKDGKDYNSDDDDKKVVRESGPPTVPEAIAHFACKDADKKPDIDMQRFKRILLDSDDAKSLGNKACPSMNTCPVAAYQDYVIASNRKKFVETEQNPNVKLKFAENYHCRNHMTPIHSVDAVASYPSARIMLCVRGEKSMTGPLAFTLNTLLMRIVEGNVPGFRRKAEEHKEWIFNIQYLKDMPCHNRHFGVNRIFGFWTERTVDDTRFVDMLKQENPIQVIEILPIGSASDACNWLAYARRIHAFLNKISEEGANYRLTWFNKSLRCTDIRSEQPAVETSSEDDPPVAIIISKMPDENKIKTRTAQQAGDFRLCTICGLQGREHSCEKWRPWYKENEFRWDVEEQCSSSQ